MAYFNSKDSNLTDDQINCIHYDEDGNELYEVNEILDKKYDSKDRTWKYLVSWKNWTEEYNTWEPLANLTMVQDIVDDFESAFRNKKKNAKNSKAKEPVIEEETKSNADTEASTVQSETIKPVGPKKEKKSKPKASVLTPQPPPVTTMNEKAQESKNVLEEVPLTDAFSAPIKKKTKEDTIDPRQKKKEAGNTTTASRDMKDNNNVGKSEGNVKPPFGSLWVEGQNGFHEDTSIQKRFMQQARGEIPGLSDKVAKESKSRFNEAASPPVAQNVMENNRSMVVEEPIRQVAEPLVPKMNMLENVLLNKEGDQHSKQVGLPEKEPQLKSQKSGNEELNKQKSPIRPPSSNYNPYNSLPFSPAVLSNTSANTGVAGQSTSLFEQLFKPTGEVQGSSAMMVEDKKGSLKMDRMSSIVDDIDKYQDDSEEVSLTRRESVSSIPTIQRNQSNVSGFGGDVKKGKGISEIIIDDDDDAKKHRKEANWGKKEKGRSRSRSRSSGNSPHSRNYKGKDKGKHMSRESKHHAEDKQKYLKNKERERSREREHREKEKERDKMKEKEKEKAINSRDRHKGAEKDDVVIKGKDHSPRVNAVDKAKHDKYAGLEIVRHEEIKIQKKRAVYKKTLHSKEQPHPEYDVSERNSYKVVVSGYLDKKIDRATFLELLCPQGNFKDDEMLEIKCISWEEKASANPEDYYFKVIWKPNSNGVQKGCRYVSWQELLEERPKEAAEFVMGKLTSIVSKYGTFGEM